MSTARRTAGVPAGVAVAVLLAGLVLWALFRVLSGAEHHAYSASGLSPDTTHVTAGKTYHLSVKGGVRALTQRGLQVSTPQCTWSTGGGASTGAGAEQALSVTAESAQTKATNVVASFTAPLSGAIDISCSGWGTIYVDDADNASADPAGLLLLLAVIALTVGVGLALSAMRTTTRRLAAQRAAGEYEHAEVGRAGSTQHDGGDGDPDDFAG